mgnify:CR=1 FL=1|jgi:hypothetical protein|tara:strand:- start:1665 stop:2918 length:1254 start_codon:yes stop_codon:yes gene_type:complete
MRLTEWCTTAENFTFEEYFKVLEKYDGVVEYIEDFDIYNTDWIGDLSDLDKMSVNHGGMMNGESGFYSQITQGIFHKNFQDFNDYGHHFWLQKWMCQSILEMGFTYPLGMLGLDMSHFGDDDVEDIFLLGYNPGTIIPSGETPSLKNPDLAWGLHPGQGRIMVSYFLGLKKIPVLFFTNKKYGISLGGKQITNYEQLKKIVIDKIEYPIIVEWDVGTKSNIERENKWAPGDVNTDFAAKAPNVGIVKFDLIHSADYKMAGWVDDSQMLYAKIARNSFPLNVYIKSDSQDDFFGCCKRIENSRKKFTKEDKFYFEGSRKWFDKYEFRFELNFIQVDSVDNIPKLNNHKGFCVFTESNKIWNRDIFELYYFGHTQKALSTFDDTVIFFNCEHPSWKYTDKPLDEHIGLIPEHFVEVIDG